MPFYFSERKVFNMTTTEHLKTLIEAVGEEVSLPDNLKTTLWQALCGAMGVDITDMTDNLISSYVKQIATEFTGGGGSGEAIGTADTPASFTGLFYTLTSGNYKSGTFMLSSLLEANTETLIFQTGLSEIKRLIVIANKFPQITDVSSVQHSGMIFYAPEWQDTRSDGHYSFRILKNGTNSSTGTQWLTINDTYRVLNGDFYATAKYKSDAYSPFNKGEEYTWIAW